MKIRKLILIGIIVVLLLGVLMNLEPSITGLVTKDLAITDVVIAADKPLDIEFDFEQSKESLNEVDKPVYYYLKIKNADFSGMNYFLVKFKVEKNWLRKNGIKKEDIGLHYLTNGWKKADVKFLNEDENYCYYEAKSEISNLFAIVVERVKTVEKEEVGENDILYFAILPLIFIGLIGLIGILGFIWLYKRIKYYWIAKVIGRIIYSVILFLVSNVIIFFGFSFLNVKGNVSGSEVLWYGLIPVFILAVVLMFVLHLLVRLYRNINFVRKIFWFVFDYCFIAVILAAVFYALPAEEVVVNNLDILIFGILPLVVVSFIVLGLFKLVERWVYRIWW